MVRTKTASLALRCINCSTSTGDHLALLGLVVAVIGVLLAFAAFVVSVRALKISQREHDEFMKQLGSRAKFDLTARVVNGEDDSRVVLGGNVGTWVRVEIGLINTGDRIAHRTTLNVVAPGGLSQFGWARVDGTFIKSDVITTSEELLPGVPSQFVSQQIDVVGLRTPTVRWIQLMVDARYSEIPLRIKAQADALPDDIQEEVLDFTITVVR